MFNDYLIPETNTTLDFHCIPRVSNDLPVTLTDMDGVVVIPVFSMRAGIDHIVYMDHFIGEIMYDLYFQKSF